MHRFPSTTRRPPRPGHHTIARPRFEAALDAAVATRRATLVIAPAGYGKTTAVVGWLARRREEAAWFTFDAGDDQGDPDAAFAACVRAALATVAPALDAGHAHERALPSSTAALAVDIERSGWHGVLVLDDTHHLGTDAALSLAAFIERGPAGVHTLVLARQAPALPAARWLTRGEADLIGADALRLDRTEGLELIAKLLPDLPEADAESLLRRVEGWPAGVRLAARSLHGRSDVAQRIERFTGSDRYMLAFLTEEVLLRLPDDLHEAALLLAGEPRLCASLVDALTLGRDGAALLERLEAHEAFLERLDPSDDARTLHDEGGRHDPWFRFPDFFRDLLTHRLSLTHPDLVETLRGRSQAWWEAQRAAATREPQRHAHERPVDEERPEPLTEREHAVLQQLAAGASTKAIARALDLSPNTVKTHTRHVFEKLGVRNRTQAADVARRHGLIPTRGAAADDTRR